MPFFCRIFQQQWAKIFLAKYTKCIGHIKPELWQSSFDKPTTTFYMLYCQFSHYTVSLSIVLLYFFHGKIIWSQNDRFHIVLFMSLFKKNWYIDASALQCSSFKIAESPLTQQRDRKSTEKKTASNIRL